MAVVAGVDTGVVQKDAGESQPNFMRFFAQEDQQKKGRKQPMAGPQNISYYFPDIPEGMELRDFVSLSISPHIFHTHTLSLLRLAEDSDGTATGGTHVRTGQIHGPRIGGSQVRSKFTYDVIDNDIIQNLSPRKRYHQKRLPILQAMDAKKKQYR